MMTIENWLNKASASLITAGIATARLDALILLEDAVGMNRTQLLARPETELSESQQNVLTGLIIRRQRHEPLAYIRGKSEFYGREFVVGPSVLVPRPESEIMIELLLDLLRQYAPTHVLGGRQTAVQRAAKASHLTTMWSQYTDQPLSLADVGAGPGALGITAALELENVTVELLEIDEAALETAKLNVIKHTTSVQLRQSDLLPEGASYQILLCNLPYVPDGFSINQAASFEPPIALFAGNDGLSLYRRLFRQIAQLAERPLLILIESFPDQQSAIKQLAVDTGYIELIQQDFIQAFGLAV